MARCSLRARCDSLRIACRASASPLATASRRRCRLDSRASASLRLARRIWYRLSISSSRRSSSTWLVSGSSTILSIPPLSPSRPMTPSSSRGIAEYAGSVMTLRILVLRSTPGFASTSVMRMGSPAGVRTSRRTSGWRVNCAVIDCRLCLHDWRFPSSAARNLARRLKNHSEPTMAAIRKTMTRTSTCAAC